MAVQHWQSLAIVPLWLTLNLNFVAQAASTPEQQVRLSSSAKATLTESAGVKKRKPLGSRSDCILKGDEADGTKTLTALIPGNDDPKKPDVWGVTTEAQPSLFVYVPRMKAGTDGKRIGQLLIKDFQSQKDVLDVEVLLPDRPGIVRLDLQTIAPKLTLESNRQYRWTFTLICSRGEPATETIDGYMQRNKLDAATSDKLSQASLRQKVELYGGKGIWYDYLKALVDLKTQKPEDAEILKSWNETLIGIGLKELVDEIKIAAVTVEKVNLIASPTEKPIEPFTPPVPKPLTTPAAP